MSDSSGPPSITTDEERYEFVKDKLKELFDSQNKANGRTVSESGDRSPAYVAHCEKAVTCLHEIVQWDQHSTETKEPYRKVLHYICQRIKEYNKLVELMKEVLFEELTFELRYAHQIVSTSEQTAKDIHAQLDFWYGLPKAICAKLPKSEELSQMKETLKGMSTKSTTYGSDLAYEVPPDQFQLPERFKLPAGMKMPDGLKIQKRLVETPHGDSSYEWVWDPIIPTQLQPLKKKTPPPNDCSVDLSDKGYWLCANLTPFLDPDHLGIS